MRKVITMRALPVLLAALSGNWAHAQETRLDEVFVTSTTIDDRFQSRRSEASSIHEISGRAIDERRPENLIEMLNAIPGVTADLSSGDELKIKLRGVENQRYMGEKPGVAIVIDGVPVFERTGKVNIDLDNIESIKVIKGGASYLFGEDALAGAVVITTKRGARYKGVTVAADTGSWGYNRQLARAGIAGDWGTGHIQVSHREADDYYWQSAYQADYIDGNLRFVLGEGSDLTFGFEKSSRFKDKHGSVKGATQALLDPEGRIGRDFTRMYDVELDKFNVTYANALTPTSNLLATAYEYRDRTFYWSSPQRMSASGQPIGDATPGAQSLYTTNNDYDQVQRGVKGEWRASHGSLGWLGGIDLRDNRYENHNTARVSYCTRMPCGNAGNVVAAGAVLDNNVTEESVQALYGELKYLLDPRLTLTGNARYDHIGLDFSSGATRSIATPFSRSRSFSVASWRIGATHASSAALDLFGNLSTGFRTPTAQQLYGGSLSPTGGKVANNETLKPERAINVELGTRLRTAALGVPLELEAAVYQVQRDDFITSSVGQYGSAGGSDVERYENVGGVRNRGLELSLKSDRQRQFTLDLAYSYTRAVFTRYEKFNQALGSPYVANPLLVSHDNTGNSVPRVPRHTLFATLGWQPGGGFRLALEMDARSWSWADEINQEKWAGRTLFNLQANYALKTAHAGRWSVFARVNNLFDKYYWTAARGTNDAPNYLSGTYDNVYNAEDLSIVVGKPRHFVVGLTGTF